jgi:hypothetical protein
MFTPTKVQPPNVLYDNLTIWDSFEINDGKDLTPNEIINFFKNKYEIQILSINYGETPIYMNHNIKKNENNIKKKSESESETDDDDDEEEFEENSFEDKNLNSSILKILKEKGYEFTKNKKYLEININSKDKNNNKIEQMPSIKYKIKF